MERIFSGYWARFRRYKGDASNDLHESSRRKLSGTDTLVVLVVTTLLYLSGLYGEFAYDDRYGLESATFYSLISHLSRL